VTGPGGNPPEGAQASLRSPVSTGRNNNVVALPFTVVSVQCPGLWNPEDGSLALSFEINDPNRRVRAGRILYFAPPVRDTEGGSPLLLHSRPLAAGLLTHGTHELPEADRWDGSIAVEGVDRERVTADLCPLTVRVEVWNRESDAPGNRAEAGSGPTDVEGEVLGRASTGVTLDVFTRADWSRDNVVPHGDPENPQHGSARMDIRVRNVADGTPVRILVARINRIPEPASDHTYTRTGLQPEHQPGLEGAVVRRGRVVLGNRSQPEVRFLNYQEHWRHPGNNFYCYYVAFGDRGGWLAASQRDHENHEADCLHMRFTVFIHRSAGDLPGYNTCADQLHNFFRNDTRYFRSYIIRGGPGSPERWLRYYRHRFMVIVLGHGGCDCTHGDHPVNSQGRRHPLYDRGFDPEGNCCPTAISSDPAVQADVAQEEQYDRSHGFQNWPAGEPLYGGCGHTTHVYHTVGLGRTSGGRRLGFHSLPGRAERDVLALRVGGGGVQAVRMEETAPRFIFFNGGCRSMLTDNLGEHFIRNQTRFYSGWVYSPGCDFGQFCYDVFTRWVQGTEEDPPEDPVCPDRFVRAYQHAVSCGTRAQHNPRLMNRAGRIPAHPDPAQVEEALE